jgi:hypothetical protein
MAIRRIDDDELRAVKMARLLIGESSVVAFDVIALAAAGSTNSACSESFVTQFLVEPRRTTLSSLGAICQGLDSDFIVSKNAPIGP